MILLQTIMDYPEANPKRVLSLALKRTRMHERSVVYQAYITDMLKAIGAKKGISVALRWHELAYGEEPEEIQPQPEEVKAKILAEYSRIGGRK